MSISGMFKEADIGLSKYRNIIGVGVIIMFIVFSLIFLYTYTQERKIAEKCGFVNEKIKCVCTKQAWDDFNINVDDKEIHLNSIYASENKDGEEKNSS